MTIEEFTPIVKKLRTVYTQANFIANKEAFDIWFEMLSDLQTSGVNKAVDNIIRDREYPPTIADIRHEYDRMYEAYKTLVREVKKEFGLACQYYPSVDLDTKSEAFDVFFTKLKKHPQGEWIALTKKFNNSTTSFVRDCEVNHKAIPKFKDYVNEQTI